MISQTAAFTRRVHNHMIPASNTVTVSPDTGCAEVLNRMRSADATCAIVIDTNSVPIGILTEQDVSRRIAFLVDAATAVSDVMTQPVKTITGNAYLHNAVAQMRRDSTRHLPVVDDATERVIGALELDHALAQVSGQTVAQIDLINHSRDIDSLKLSKTNQFQVAAELLADKIPAPEVQQLLTRLNHEIYRDVIQLSIQAMAADGHGPAPVAFDVIVMGSGGRGENFLTPDQDNGFIIDDYPDAEHTRIDAWFIELAERMTKALDQIGLPFCHGFVMATNPMWRKTRSQWREQISGWIRRGEGNFLRLCDIFFDFACVYGDGQFSAELRQHIAANAARPVFLRELYKVDEEHDVALGPFGWWFLTERQPGPNKGKINLKQTGTLPLINAIRVLSLRQRVTVTSTLARIDALREGGTLSADEQDGLSNGYQHISNLLLRQQLSDAAAGREPGNHVPKNALSAREKKLLADSFKAIKSLRSRLRTDLTGDIF